MRVLIHKNYGDLSKWTALYLADKINTFQATPENPFVLGLPTGSSILGTYSSLIELVKKGFVSFQNVVTFNMDEYVGLPEGHPQSYRFFMEQNFFNHIDIRQENINLLNGNVPDTEAECQRFEDKIKSYGAINLFLGGIGTNGHIAFNEPGSSLKSKTRLINLTQETRLANSRFFGNNISQVPKTALTVGIDTVMQAREVVLVASGFNKARAVQKVIEEGVDTLWTASALQLHANGMVVCDEAAAKDLKPETIRYFKDIEKEELGKGFPF
jgi:glucosamine-6-phosphate deaminase